MSLIAGISAGPGGWSPSSEPAFRGQLRNFSIIPGEIPDDYDMDVTGLRMSGDDAADDDKAGSDAAGNDAAGDHKAGRDAAGNDAAGDHKAGRDAAGNDAAGDDAAGLIVGSKLKNTSMDTIIRVKAGGVDVFCLGYNEFLRDTVDAVDTVDAGNARDTRDARDTVDAGNAGTLPDMTGDELLRRIREADGEYVAVAVTDPAGDFAAPGTSSGGALHIITDRFASRPCFFSSSGGAFRFSTNLAFLLEMIPGGVTLDPLPLMQLLSIGHTLSGRTTFREVDRIRPAEHLIVENGRITSRQTYYRPGVPYSPLPDSPTPDGPIPDSPITDYKAHAGQTYAELAASVEKRSRGRTGFVSLSGGLDSRLIAAAADRERFTAFTFINSLKPEETPDVSAARQVAKKLKLKHAVFPLGETGLISDIIEDVLRLTGGQTAVHHPVKTMSFIRHMQEHGFHMGGGSGGVFAGSEVSSRIVRESDDMIAAYNRKRLSYADDFLRKLFRNRVDEDLPGILRNSLRTSLDAIDASDPARKITIWALIEGQAAFTFLSPIHTHPDVAESSPHLGCRYAERMLNLTGRELVNKNFYQFMIYHCLEDLRGVRYANSGQTLNSELISRHYPLKRFSRYAGLLTKIRRKVAKRLHSGKGRKPHFHYQMVRSDKKALERTKELLQEHAALRQLFNTGECLSFIRRFEEGNIEFASETDANAVSFLMTVAHMTEVFPVKENHLPSRP